MPDQRRTTYRKVTFVRPHRVVRSPEETVAVWRARGRRFAVMAASWLVIAVLFATGGDGGLAVGLAVAASVLSALVVVKAVVIVARNRDSGSA